jgi:outer membrane immunogenic protein
MEAALQKLVGLLAALAFSGSAFAADMAVKAPPPPPAPAFSWTGLYLGGFVGDSWSHVDNTFTVPPIGSTNTSSSNGIGGGFVGGQYQFDKIVLGVEGDVATLFNRSLGSTVCDAALCGAVATITRTLNDPIWSVGGRGGIAFDRWLPYVSGGYASTSYNQTTCVVGACPVTIFTVRDNGYYIGGGVDWAVYNGWVAGVEYRHYGFNTVMVIPTLVATGAPLPTAAQTTAPKIDAVMFRLSYLFNPMLSGR